MAQAGDAENAGSTETVEGIEKGDRRGSAETRKAKGSCKEIAAATPLKKDEEINREEK